MKRAIFAILLLLTLAAQGVAIELLPAGMKFADIYIIPHRLLMMLILQVTYEETDNTLIPILYGAIFGLITDIVYTGILGIYMFVLALSVYVVQLLHRLFQTNYITNVFFSIVSVLVMEIALLFIYTFFFSLISHLLHNLFLIFISSSSRYRTCPVIYLYVFPFAHAVVC